MSVDSQSPDPAFAAEGQTELIWLFLLWMAIWFLLFQILAQMSTRWLRELPPSSKEHENEKYWFARNVIGIIHAVLVALICVPAAIWLAGRDSSLQFASSRHLPTCKPDEMMSGVEPMATFFLQTVAFAGLAFTTFTAADLFISIIHGQATADYVVHHVVFILAGLILRGNCMLPYSAAILLAMEASTPFLNLFLLLRHRGPAYQTLVKVNAFIFVTLFVVFRLVLNTYGIILLWSQPSFGVPSRVPKWEAYFLASAIVCGAIVQFLWFPGIARIFLAKYVARSSEEEEPVSRESSLISKASHDDR